MNKYVLWLFLALCSVQICRGQNFIPYYDQIVDQCSYDTLLNNLQILEASGVKELGSFALTKTKNWIMAKYASFGYTDIREDPFTYAGYQTSNIIVTKTGQVYPNQYIILDAHYDTRTGPGANDNGSGTVALLEIARLLKEVHTEYSLIFIHFSAEELGLVGSWHYVENVALPANLDIKLVFNIDAIGGVDGMINNTILCERDETGPPSSNNEASASYTEELANCVGLYSGLAPEISHAYASDYMPFEYQNKVITGLAEKNTSPYYHTSEDVISHLDLHYLQEVTRAAMGASLHFSRAFEGSVGLPEGRFLQHAVVYPNPFRDHVSIYLGEMPADIRVRVRNTFGQLLVDRYFESVNHMSLNLELLIPGIYILTLETPSGQARSLLIVKE